MSAARVALVEFEPRWLDELVCMWRASFEAGVGIVDPHPLAQQRSYFVDEVLPRNDVCVARQDGRIVGFIAATRESIAQLYVRVGCQRQGIGRALLEWAKDRSSGYLWLYTFARNRGAQAFYERNGFVVAARGFEPTWQLEDIRYEWSRTQRTSSDAVRAR